MFRRIVNRVCFAYNYIRGGNSVTVTAEELFGGTRGGRQASKSSSLMLSDFAKLVKTGFAEHQIKSWLLVAPGEGTSGSC